MTWRYPEPRALSAVDLVPLPLSTPVLVNTLNMGEEYQVCLHVFCMTFFTQWLLRLIFTCNFLCNFCRALARDASGDFSAIWVRFVACIGQEYNRVTRENPGSD